MGSLGTSSVVPLDLDGDPRQLRMWYSSWYGEADFCGATGLWCVPLQVFCFSSFSRFAPFKSQGRRAPMIAFVTGLPPPITRMNNIRALRTARQNRMAVRGKARWRWPYPRETAYPLFTSPAVVLWIRHCVREARFRRTGFALRRASDPTLRFHFHHAETPLFHPGTEGGLL
jgi:hypothetical protein